MPLIVDEAELKRMVRCLVVEALQDFSSQPQAQTQPAKPEKDWESVPSEVLKQTKERGAAEEKCRRAYHAIAAYNDAQPEFNNKWVIGVRSIQDLAGVNHAVASRWVSQYGAPINDHNTKHGLGQFHNQRHGKNGVKIGDMISWTSQKTNQASSIKSVGQVYLMHCPQLSLYKIGFSFKPKNRVKAIELELSIEEDRSCTVHLVATVSCEDPRNFEHFLHHQFHQYWVKGEWFRLSQEALDYLLSEFNNCTRQVS